jgi:histidinol phosphatase-like PHP family hydrolase
MDIDLHVHTSERSGCANVSEEYQIQSAIRAGLGGIAITDHDALVPQERLRALNDRYAPFKIFTGIEVSADDLHWGVLGIHDPALESRSWNYPALLRFVRERGGFIYLAHPFRYKPVLHVDLDAYTPDGIEIESLNSRSIRRFRGRMIFAGSLPGWGWRCCAIRMPTITGRLARIAMYCQLWSKMTRS